MSASPTLLDRPTDVKRARRRRLPFVLALLLVTAVLAGYIASRPNSPQATRWLLAQGVQGRSDQDLVQVEAALVGGAAVADPATGRLPDVAAFHRAGIASLRVDNGRLTVEFLPAATEAQARTARTALLASPSIATVSDGTGTEGSPTASPVLDTAALARSVGASVGKPDGQPGVIVLLSTPQGAWASGFGVADLASGMPMSPALQYRIGSTTKTFTAVVVLQLVAEGRIGLDAPVAEYLPGVLPYPEPITVRELLAHTSGLVDPSHFGPLNVVPDRDVPKVKDPATRALAMQALAAARTSRSVVVPPFVQVAVMTTRPLAFSPGTRYAYSNTDYLVLTMLVEKVTGKPLADAYRARILDPLGLTQTYLADSIRFTGPYVRSYEAPPGQALTDVTDDLSAGTAGAGALVSTAADVTTFFRALLGGRLLPEPLLRQMMTPTPGSAMSDVMDAYGLGLTRYITPCGRTAWGHGGAIGGYMTDAYASPDGRVVAVFAENAVGRQDIRAEVTGGLFCSAPPPG